MFNGRRFSAHFEDDTSRASYYTWSAAQMLVYNAKVQESAYFWAFHRKFWSPVPLPEPDQKYSHLLDYEVVPWVKDVPGGVKGVGAYHFFQAQQRFLRGTSGRPRTKKIQGSDRQLTLPRNFFSLEQISNKYWRLNFGLPARPGGSIRFRAHRKFEMPAVVYVRLTNRSLTVSFSFEDDIPDYSETDDEIVARLRMKDPAELAERTVGNDWGVVRNVQRSDGPTHHLLPQQIERIKRFEQGRKHLQHQLSRKEKDSKNSKKLKGRICKKFQYEQNVHIDFAHKTSHELATLENVDLIVFEKLQIANMTKRPRVKYDENGNVLPNGRTAKAGLHRSLLRSQYGRITEFTKYKCRQNGKLFVEVDPKGTSQECHTCHHTARENRPDQATFRCTNPNCPDFGVEMNADLQASLVIKQRGVNLVLSGGLRKKTSKKFLSVPRAKKNTKNVGVGRPETMPVKPSKGRGLRCSTKGGCQASQGETSQLPTRGGCEAGS